MVTDYKIRLNLPEINRLAAHDPQGLIDQSEDRYRRQIRQVADAFCRHMTQNRLILLAGPSSSGKTTTSLNLQAELHRRGINTLSISLDDFFEDRALAPYLPDGTQDLESPALVDVEELERCLSLLEQNGQHDFPLYDFTIGKRSQQRKTLHYDDHTAIIIEGLHAINPVICARPYFLHAMKIYISVKAEYYLDERRILSTREMRMLRRIIRDNNFRGCGPAATLGMWGNVVAGEERYIRPFRTAADFWIDSLHLYEPLLYRSMLEELLEPLRGDTFLGDFVGRILEQVSFFSYFSMEGIPADSLMREFIVFPETPSEK